jgi:signal transduction histidine kinase
MEDCDSEHLAAVATAHDRVGTLIEDLLAVSRTDKQVSDTERIDLARLSETCWQMVPTANATLVTETDHYLLADRSRLQQLLENLIRNAVENGGEDTTVTIGELDAGFYVEDDGPGIPTEERTQVLETGISTTPGGTGIGLSIVTRVAEAHSWQLRITEGRNGGARFEITGVELVS